MIPRWTDETVDLTARATYDCWDARLPGAPLGWDQLSPTNPLRASYREAAVAVLTALADAGLLVPPDAVREEQRGVCVLPETDRVSVCGPQCGEEGHHDRVRYAVTFTGPWTARDGSPE